MRSAVAIGIALLSTWANHAHGWAVNTFTVASGDWHTPGNWSQGEVPDASDTVQLQTPGTGIRLCRITAGDAVALNLDLQAGTTIEIVDKTLTVGRPSGATTSTVTYTLVFKEEDENLATVPTMKVYNNTTFTGPGKILTDGPAGHIGEITWKTSSADTITFSGGLSLNRSLFFNMHVTSGPNAFRTASDFDTGNPVPYHMYFGPATGNTYKLLGSGHICAMQGGIITIRKMDLNGSGSSYFTGLLFPQDNGALNITELAAANSTYATVLVEGGLLDVDSNLGAWYGSIVKSSSGDFTGRIDVAPGKVAVMQPPF